MNSASLYSCMCKHVTIGQEKEENNSFIISNLWQKCYNRKKLNSLFMVKCNGASKQKLKTRNLYSKALHQRTTIKVTY